METVSEEDSSTATRSRSLELSTPQTRVSLRVHVARTHSCALTRSTIQNGNVLTNTQMTCISTTFAQTTLPVVMEAHGSTLEELRVVILHRSPSTSGTSVRERHALLELRPGVVLQSLSHCQVVQTLPTGTSHGLSSKERAHRTTRQESSSVSTSKTQT